MKLTFSDKGAEGVHLEFEEGEDPALLGAMLFTITSGALDEQIIQAIYNATDKEVTSKVAEIWDSLILKSRDIEDIPLVRPLRRKKNGK